MFETHTLSDNPDTFSDSEDEMLDVIFTGKLAELEKLLAHAKVVFLSKPESTRPIPRKLALLLHFSAVRLSTG